ncbi:hypothetical protein ACLUU9_08300 [Rothia mucilaginosa]|uniref:Uncharacterized protein n=1 Tax=Rothia mucilaginosa M508 TaxID=563033 RepID=G5EQI7_9MICC|nr:hypothetical protein HMPREF0737_00547 [Rothia mucilaginosa M508]
MSRTLGGRAGLVEPLLDHALTTLLSVESALSLLLSASRHRLREVGELVRLGEVHVRVLNRVDDTPNGSVLDPRRDALSEHTNALGIERPSLLA